jgi:3-methylcrotonyl-CoA carboxylase beta subunit
MSSLVDTRPNHTQVSIHQLPLLDSYTINKNSEPYKSAIRLSNQQVVQLRNRLRLVRQGGGTASVKKHQARNKMVARDRIDALIDPGSPFLELSSLAGMYSYPDDDDAEIEEEMNVPSGSIVTGIGVITGVPTMIVANDATVKGVFNCLNICQTIRC